MLFIYNVLLTLYFIVALPYYAVQMVRLHKYRAGLKQRLGWYPLSISDRLKERRCIWLHAVSVGEVLAVMPLIKLIERELPSWNIVLSTVTATGQKVAQEKLGGRAVVIYFPLDLRFAVRRALRLISPDLIVLVETEIWPNFISSAACPSRPLVILNGRISDRSFRGYRLARSFLKPLLRKIDLFSMQTELDARRIQAIGAPPDRIKISGNMKFDCGISPASEQDRAEAAACLGLSPQQKVIVAGSTHRGEDEIALDLFREVRRRHPESALVIVPRHPERASEIEELAGSRGENCVLWSQMQGREAPPPYTVLIVDTIGELVNIYRAATIVFVGKSLVSGGGQNIIEPASMGKPVFFGPSMENFREAAKLLLTNRAAIQVRDGAELRERILSLLENEDERVAMGRRAAETMALSRGATEKNLSMIKELIYNG